MRSGPLRHLIQIQQATETRDAVGGIVTTWSAVASPRAEIITLSGREYFAAQAVHSETTTRIRIRHRAGIVPKMRVLHGSTTYDILAPIDPDGRKEELHLFCKVVSSSVKGVG